MPRTSEIRVKSNNSTLKSASRSTKTASEKLVTNLRQQIELLQNRVEITSTLLNQEKELKLSCFAYLVRTHQYDEWERFRRDEEAKRLIKHIASLI